MKPPTIGYLSDIYFEPDTVQLLPELLDHLNIQRPLIVTDKGLVSMGLIADLPLEGVPVFDDIETNPAEESVLAARDAFLKNKCDGVIAVGGGSPMDCARCAAMMVTHAEPLEQYAFLGGGLPKIRKDKPPVINIPTTAGTGSEVGRAALITLATGRKMAFISPYFYPAAVLCDPLLTLELPHQLTAATGMDAICHCIETYCSPKFNPVAEAIGLDGLRRGYQAIRTAVTNGADVAARSEMLMSALEGGMSLQKGLGLVHSLSHPLGALKGKRLHHGTLNAIFLPHILRFNMDSCTDKMDRIADAVGFRSRVELPDFFSNLIAEIGLPRRLSELGVTADDCESLVPLAFGDHCTATNPRLATAEDCRMLFSAAL